MHFPPFKVDDNVTRHLDTVLKRGDWDVLILHYLGLDHIGHVSGPHSPLIGRKLGEMDSVLMRIHTSLLSQVSRAVVRPGARMSWCPCPVAELKWECGRGWLPCATHRHRLGLHHHRLSSLCFLNTSWVSVELTLQPGGKQEAQ